MRTRALEFVAPRQVALTEVELPPLDPGHALVRTHYSGISAGTEMLAYRGEIDPELPLDETIGALSGTFRFPFRYGYSCVGTVEEAAGAEVTGSLVFVLHPHQELVVAPVPDLVPIGSVPARAATLFPLVETALQIALDAGEVADELVVVAGLGAVGLFSALLLARNGAVVIASEPLEWRRHLAAELGIVASRPEEIASDVAARSDGGGAGLLVECSGNPSALAEGLPLLRHEGCALVASWYGTKPVELPLGADFHRRRLVIRSTQVSTIPARLASEWSIERRRAEAVRLLEELPLGRLATHEFAFEDAASAYAAVERADAGLVHAALRYEL